MVKSYLGIDVHKKDCSFTELSAEGKILRKSHFGNNLESLSGFVSSLGGHEAIVLEPVLNYLWLLDYLEPCVASVHVATPYKVRVIAESKSKTDGYDSRILAELLRTNFLPESWVPPRAIRVLRDIIRQRFRLVKTVVRHKNHIRHLLFLQGHRLRAKNVASKLGRRQISRLCLPENLRLSINQCLQIITGVEPMIADLDRQLEQRSRDLAEVTLLRTIPGVGPLWSVTIYAEIGDIDRFHRPKALSSYAGLVPTVRSSGDSVYHGGLTHLGSKPLRLALVEAATRAARVSPPLRRLYHRVLYRSNKQKARVAVARKLSRIVYQMLKKNEPFRAS